MEIVATEASHVLWPMVVYWRRGGIIFIGEQPSHKQSIWRLWSWLDEITLKALDDSQSICISFKTSIYIYYVWVLALAKLKWGYCTNVAQKTKAMVKKQEPWSKNKSRGQQRQLFLPPVCPIGCQWRCQGVSSTKGLQICSDWSNCQYHFCLCCQFIISTLHSL